MARKTSFVIDAYYHTFNRGVKQGDIFLDDTDYTHWVDLVIWCLRYSYPFSFYLDRVKRARLQGLGPDAVAAEIKRLHRLKQPPVEVTAWVLMPNHFHLVLKQLEDGGISKFLHRISLAYAHYFNRRHGGSGAVFQGTFKAVLIESEEQLVHVSRYVHINPRTLGLTNWGDLAKYPWSSLPAYLDKREDSLTTTQLLLNHFGSVRKLREFTRAQITENEVVGLEGLAIDDDLGWFRKIEEMKKARREELIREIKAS